MTHFILFIYYATNRKIKSIKLIDLIESFGEEKVFSHIQEELGGWPVLDENFDANNIDLIERIIHLRRISERHLFEFMVTTNPKLPKRYILKV